MSIKYHSNYLIGLVQELRKLPKETEWVEFKLNRADAEEIGEYISALANSAVLAGKSNAYVVWGIEDSTHSILGTRFNPTTEKVSNEELENWLLRFLSPRVEFRFHQTWIEDKSVVLLEIGRAFRHPVKFKNIEYIRVGSYKKKLCDFPEKARKLWRELDDSPFESMPAVENVSDDEVIQLLDYPSYFDLLRLPLPETRSSILEALEADALIVRSEAGGWNVLNLGAILFARHLESFPRLSRKAMRVIHYRGNSRVETHKEQQGSKGYAAGFEGLITYINGLLPSNEMIGQALRRDVPVYPELAVRELVANALIHQDFLLTGTGPMIEIFGDRMEITNPGCPLVEPDRFLDKPPRSRNERLASLMRRAGICEERGSGIDKVVSQTEFFQLPAPKFEESTEHTRASLFAPKPANRMDRQDRVRACYLHACLRYVTNDFMTNASLRKRLGIGQKNSGAATRIIKQTIDEGLVRPYDELAGRKLMRYLPYWA